MPKSTLVKAHFIPGSSRNTRSVHSLLRQMAEDSERLAAQGARIKALREAMRAEDGKRITQPVVADAVGVSLRGYQLWEAGRGGLKPENVKALSEYFAVSEEYIEYGDRELPETTTPDPFDDHDPLGRIVGLVSGLDEQIRLLRGELAARDAEVLKRLDAGFGTS